MKTLICFLFLLGIHISLSADFDIYCSSSNSDIGVGTLASPYRSLSSLPWATIANQIGIGNTVRISLQKGSVFREQLTVGAGGTTSAHVVFQAYDSSLATNNPAIVGSEIMTGFARYSPGLGSTWSLLAPAGISYLFLNGERLAKGADANSLQNRQWFLANSQLYLRLDEGNPDTSGLHVEASVRNACVYLIGLNFVDFTDIDMSRSGTYVARLRTNSNITLTKCRLTQGGILLELDSAANFSATACIFEEGYDSNNAVRITGTPPSFRFSFCLFHNFMNGTGVGITSADQGFFVNCTFAGARIYHIWNSSTGSIAAANCIFSGVGAGSVAGGRPAIQSLAGNFAVSNCLVMASGKNPTLRLSGVTESGTVWGEPGYLNTRYPGIMMFGRDDSPAIDDALALSGLLKNYGWGMTYAFTSSGAGIQMDASVTNKLRTIVNNGSEITCHGRDHVLLNEQRVFALKYAGNAATATLSISGSNLLTTLSGMPDVALDLNSPAYSTMSGVVSALNAAGYQCTWQQAAGSVPYTLPSWLLQSVTDQDILTAPYTNLVDYPVYLKYELEFAKAELESMISSDYKVSGITYPYGQFNDSVISNALTAGYTHGRGVTVQPTPGYLLATNDTFQLALSPNIEGGSAVLALDNDANDGSGAGNHFISTGVTYSSDIKFRGTHSAYFDGSSYLSRPSNSSFDFSSGDWLFCAFLYPSSLTNTQTLFYRQSTNSSFLRIFLDQRGTINVEAQANGGPSLRFSSGDNCVTAGVWQKVVVQETYSKWSIRLNDVIIGVTNSPIRLTGVGGTIYVGCGVDLGNSLPQDFYSGYMDDVIVGHNTYFYTQSVLDQICEEGCVVEMYGHGEGHAPQELWRVMFDAVRDYSGQAIVMTEAQATDYMRSNGVLSSLDGRTVIRTNSWSPANDYRLRSFSAARGAGLTWPLIGQTNLFDLSGNRITGANGELLTETVDLGAYQYGFPPDAVTITDFAIVDGVVTFSFLAELGVTYLVQYASDPQESNWRTLRTIEGLGEMVQVTDTPFPASQRYYRIATR